MAQWVRSKYSEEADRWKVVPELEDQHTYFGKVPTVGNFNVRLPKSEFVPCGPPPTHWEVCTREVIKLDYGVLWLQEDGEWRCALSLPVDYRWTFIEKHPIALAIERKVKE